MTLDVLPDIDPSRFSESTGDLRSRRIENAGRSTIATEKPYSKLDEAGACGRFPKLQPQADTLSASLPTRHLILAFLDIVKLLHIDVSTHVHFATADSYEVFDTGNERARAYPAYCTNQHPLGKRITLRLSLAHHDVKDVFGDKTSESGDEPRRMEIGGRGKAATREEWRRGYIYGRDAVHGGQIRAREEFMLRTLRAGILTDSESDSLEAALTYAGKAIRHGIERGSERA
ncbi:hypothetical protein R3P38DRAFT_3164497 [Favolaschia claudopus]|uniref:Uncharacterized protein n=1 Tax=Favolaschia claudopus TaxID=2862362 RepID=A0AAW0EFL7_9AGAR